MGNVVVENVDERYKNESATLTVKNNLFAWEWRSIALSDDEFVCWDGKLIT